VRNGPEFGIVYQWYREKCAEVGVRCKRRRFKAVHTKGRAHITAIQERIDSEEYDEEHCSPLFICYLHDDLYYWAKVIDQMVYINTLTSSELKLLGYRED